MAKRTGKPVRVVYSRAEDAIQTHHRMNFKTHVKIGLKKDGKIGIEAGSYIESGQTATFQVNLPCEGGTYVAIGQDIPWEAADPGTYTVTGQTVNLVTSRMILDEAGFPITDEAGEYILEEWAPSTYQITIEAGSYVEAGQDVGLEYTAGIATINEKLALIGFQQPFNPSIPISSDGLGKDDKQQLIWGYPGILWGVEYVIEIAAGAFSVAGQIASLLADNRISVETDAFTITGQALTFRVNLPCSTGAYTETGQAVSLEKGSLVSIEAGNYTEAGQTAGLEKDSRISIEAGSYAETGQTASLEKASEVDIGAGSYVFTGQDAALIKTGAISILAEAGSYAETGQAVALKKAAEIDVGIGSFTVTGQTATLRVNLPCEAGTYSETGQTLNLLKDGRISSGAGSYVESGQIVGLLKDAVIVSDETAYVLAGQIAGLLKGKVVQAGTDVFAVAGQAAALKYTRIFGVEGGVFVFTGMDATLNLSTATPVSDVIPFIFKERPIFEFKEKPPSFLFKHKPTFEVTT